MVKNEKFQFLYDFGQYLLENTEQEPGLVRDYVRAIEFVRCLETSRDLHQLRSELDVEYSIIHLSQIFTPKKLNKNALVNVLEAIANHSEFEYENIGVLVEEFYNEHLSQGKNSEEYRSRLKIEAKEEKEEETMEIREIMGDLTAISGYVDSSVMKIFKQSIYCVNVPNKRARIRTSDIEDFKEMLIRRRKETEFTRKNMPLFKEK